MPETSKHGTWCSGQFVKGAQVSSPFVMAVAWTARMCSVVEVGTGVEGSRDNLLVLMLKMTDFWVWGSWVVMMEEVMVVVLCLRVDKVVVVVVFILVNADCRIPKP